jgi:hypothetical protein
MNIVVDSAYYFITSKSIQVMETALSSGKTTVDRELSVFASFLDYCNNKKENPETAELRNSEKYIGRSILEFI